MHLDELWVAPSPPNGAYNDLIAQAQELRIAVIRHVAGKKFDFGGAHFDVLAPVSDAYLAPKRINDASMLLKLRFENASALLEGEAEKREENLITPLIGAVNVLKVAHHGSNSSSNAALLTLSGPNLRLYRWGNSTDMNIRAPKFLTRLVDSGACIFPTDFDGAVTLYLDANGVTLARWGSQNLTMEFPSRWIPPQPAGHCGTSQ